MKYIILMMLSAVLTDKINAQSQEDIDAILEQKAYWLYLNLSYHIDEGVPDFANIDNVILDGESMDMFVMFMEDIGDIWSFTNSNDIYLEVAYDIQSYPEYEFLAENKDFQELLQKYHLSMITDRPASRFYNANAINVHSDEFINYYAFQQELVAKFDVWTTLNSDLYHWGNSIYASIGSIMYRKMYYNIETNEIVFYRWEYCSYAEPTHNNKLEYYTYYNLDTKAVREEAFQGIGCSDHEDEY